MATNKKTVIALFLVAFMVMSMMASAMPNILLKHPPGSDEYQACVDGCNSACAGAIYPAVCQSSCPGACLIGYY